MMNPHELIKSKDLLFKPNEEMLDADFGIALHTKKLGVHWVSLPKGERTFLPHAESHEEEFVYVVSGRPHVWINGFIYQLEPGFAVGFPAGTGIAHTFINNTGDSVEMIMLGDRTKDENKCAFPINPEMKEKNSFMWWPDAPKQDLGGHDAKPGNLNFEKKWTECAFIQNTNLLKHEASWSYPGDTEKFSEGVRLTNHLGLSSLGIWHEVLKPGVRSSWPHAHKVEEEFALVIKGHGQVWLNGQVYNLKPGDGVFFKPGTNIAHVLMNQGSENFEYLGIGQADGGGPEDKIYYPLHPERNQQCRDEKYYWEDAPVIANYGSKSADPR